MIKGTATLQVSDKTVALAMQEYLDRRLAEGMQVTVVALSARQDPEGRQQFEFTIAEKEVPAS